MANTPAKKLTYDNKPVQVESAIRDGSGLEIAATYQKKPAVYERTTNSSTSTICTLIQFNASDYKANGYLAHFRFRVKSTLQDTYPSDNEFIINYAYRTATIVVLNSKWSSMNDIVQYIYAYIPNSDTYLDTGNYFIAFRTGRVSTNFTMEILEADVPYTVPATMSASTTTNTSYQILSPGDYTSNYPVMWTGTAVGSITGSASAATSSEMTSATRQGSFRTGESDLYRLMAVDHTGVAYKINTSTKKFPLPISMYWGKGYNAATTTNDAYTSTRNSTTVSYLTSSSYNNFTIPTLTADDGGKTLYVRGSLDADGYFVCDGNVTLSMGAGYTYIPFGTLTPSYSGTTAQVPTKFAFNAISVPAFTLDANGKLTHIDGKKVGGTSQMISSPIEQRTLTLVSSTDTEYSAYPYKYSFTCMGVTSTRTVDVTFDVGDALSGNFAPICETGTDVIYIWAKASQSTARIGYTSNYAEDTFVVSGTVGDDTHPVKIVNGQPVAITTPVTKITISSSAPTGGSNGDVWIQY